MMIKKVILIMLIMPFLNGCLSSCLENELTINQRINQKFVIAYYNGYSDNVCLYKFCQTIYDYELPNDSIIDWGLWYFKPTQIAYNDSNILLFDNKKKKPIFKIFCNIKSIDLKEYTLHDFSSFKSKCKELNISDSLLINFIVSLPQKNPPIN